MSESPLLIDRRDSYRVLTFNRPKQLNAFDTTIRAAFTAALTEASADPACRAVLITGTGRGFCAGQDLADSSAKAKENGGFRDAGALIEREYNPIVRLIRTMPKPVVMAVNGIAAGGGANLALAGDIVIAARSAKFLQAFINIGLIPDVGGTWFLPRVVGDARARALAMLGEPISAETAAQWGMIWRVTEDAELMPEAHALTTRLAALPTQAIGLMKRAFDASQTNTLDQQLGVERDLQREAANSADNREGMRAFLEKRKPVFTGR